MAPPLGIAPSSHRLTGGLHTLCIERNGLRDSAHRKPRSALRIAAGAAIEMVLPRGLAPRTSAFAKRRAETLTPRELKMVRHAGSPIRQPPLFPASSSVLPRRSARPPADFRYSLPPPRRFGMRDAEASLTTGRGALAAERPEPQHRRARCYTNDAFESGGCVRYRAGLSSASARR